LTWRRAATNILDVRRNAPDPGRAEEVVMPLFLIERAFADLVPTDPETMAAVRLVNDEIGIQWLFSFLSADKRKTYCLYEAPNPEAIRAAARRLGIPADTIVEVSEVGPEAALIAALRPQDTKGVQPGA
jgi:Nickel responsive protein SCO4226-like